MNNLKLHMDCDSLLLQHLYLDVFTNISIHDLNSWVNNEFRRHVAINTTNLLKLENQVNAKRWFIDNVNFCDFESPSSS